MEINVLFLESVPAILHPTKQYSRGTLLAKPLLRSLFGRSESHRNLHGAGYELKRRNIWYSTIHDSVVVLKEHQEEVKKLILQQFLRAVGVAPFVKPEDLLGGLLK